MNAACERCEGACCEYFELPLPANWSQSDLLWLGLHGALNVARRSLAFACACQALLPTGRCAIYDTRPLCCVAMAVGGADCRAALARQRPGQEAYILGEEGPNDHQST